MSQDVDEGATITSPSGKIYTEPIILQKALRFQDFSNYYPLSIVPQVDISEEKDGQRTKVRARDKALRDAQDRIRNEDAFKRLNDDNIAILEDGIKDFFAGKSYESVSWTYDKVDHPVQRTNLFLFRNSGRIAAIGSNFKEYDYKQHIKMSIVLAYPNTKSGISEGRQIVRVELPYLNEQTKEWDRVPYPEKASHEAITFLDEVLIDAVQGYNDNHPISINGKKVVIDPRTEKAVGEDQQNN